MRSFSSSAGADLLVQFAVNPWLEHSQILTSLDLAKREEILPSLRQSHWDLVVVDEAHRMSAVAEDKKSLRYKLGELLRDITDHYLPAHRHSAPGRPGELLALPPPP